MTGTGNNGPPIGEGRFWKSAFFEMSRLTFSDIVHDRVLHACTVLALVGIVTPLFILTGLKHGYIELLRDRLRDDPRYLEIRPREVPELLTQDWFSRYRRNPDTAFIVPSVIQVDRGTSYAMTLQHAGSSEESSGVVVDPIATEEGDPLLRWHGIPVPSENQCVLSEAAAESLHVAIGDRVSIQVKRSGGEASRQFVVIGVVPRVTVAKPAILLRLEVTERIRSFKYGFSVPEYDWHGGNNQASPVYSHLVVLTRPDFPETVKYSLPIDTGFSALIPLDPEDVPEAVGIAAADGVKAFLLEAAGRPGSASNVDRVSSILAGNLACLLVSNPWFSGRLTGGKGSADLTLRSVGIEGSEELLRKDQNLPEWMSFRRQREDDFGKRMRILAVSPQVAGSVGNGPWRLSIKTPGGILDFPVSLESSGDLRNDDALVPAPLGGIVRSGQRSVSVRFRSEDDMFIVDRGGYQSFRLFAKDSSGVLRLAKALASEGISADANIEEIENIAKLDSNLGKLIDVIGLVTIAGGAAALAGGLMLSVDRKKREFGLLRLYGVPPRLLAFVIVMQSGVLMSCTLLLSAALSFLFFQMVAAELVASLGTVPALLPVTSTPFLRIAAGGMLIAIGVAMVVSLRILRIEPADSIRWR